MLLSIVAVDLSTSGWSGCTETRLWHTCSCSCTVAAAESGIGRRVASSHWSNMVCRVALRRLSIMPRCSSGVNEPAGPTDTVR